MRLREVTNRVGMSRSWIYEEIAAGRFPKPIRIGERARAWVEAEVADYIDARVKQRDTELARGPRR